MESLVDWSGRDVLDLGCGTGFHLPGSPRARRSVVGVEPHPDLVALARRRTRALPSVTVTAGLAESLPLPDASVDVVHARWAYFFGPGCEPGLAELDRVVRRGGTALVIDNDPTRSTFGGWFQPRLPGGRPGRRRAVLVECTAGPGHRSTWAGGSRPVPTWRPSYASSFPPRWPRTCSPTTTGVEVDYAVNLWSKEF